MTVLTFAVAIPKSTLETLPAEIIIEIFEYCAQRDWVQLSRTNRKFKSLADLLIWRDPLKVMAAAFECAPHKYTDRGSELEAFSIRRIFSEITSLFNSDEDNERVKAMDERFDAFIQSLELSPICGLPRVGSCIRDLNLSTCFRSGFPILDDQVLKIVNAATHIMRLNLSNCPYLTNASISHLTCSSNVQHITRISLTNMPSVSENTLTDFICACDQLTRISLQECNNVNDRTIIRICARFGSHLKRIRINGCQFVGNRALIEGVSQCNNLEWLDVGHIPGIGDEGLLEISKSCPNITWIDISQTIQQKTVRLSDASIIALVANCKNLELLDISNCHLITDEGLVSLANNATKLKSLSLKGLPFITSQSVMKLGQLRRIHRNLVWLQVFNCQQITGGVIDEMIQQLNDGWRKGPYDSNVHRSVMNGRSWEDVANV